MKGIDRVDYLKSEYSHIRINYVTLRELIFESHKFSREGNGRFLSHWHRIARESLRGL